VYSMDTKTKVVSHHQIAGLPIAVYADYTGQSFQISSIVHSCRISRTDDMATEPHPRMVSSRPPILMQFLPESHTLLSLSQDGTCNTWSSDDGSESQQKLTTASPLLSATLSSQRTHLLAVDCEHQGHVFLLPDYTKLEIPDLHENVAEIAISSDNQQLYVLSTNGDLRVARLAPPGQRLTSELLCTDVDSIQSSPTNPPLLMVSRRNPTGNQLAVTLLDTNKRSEVTIGDSLNPAAAAFAEYGDHVVIRTSDQRLMKMTLRVNDGQWLVEDDSVTELATGILHFACPADSKGVIAVKRNETEFLSLDNSGVRFVLPFDSQMSRESKARWEKATMSPDGRWFTVTGRTLECWPANLTRFVSMHASRQLTATERKRYDIRYSRTP